MNYAQISVIIPTYNSWETLESCIKSIQKQSVKPFEIIVVDNASTDNTKKNTKKLFKKDKKIKYFRNEKNLGVTGGRNRGIKEATKDSDYLFFFDHDMVADKSMLKELVKVAESKKDIGIVTPKIYFWEDKARIWSAGTGINLWTGQVIFRGGKDEGQYDKAEEVQVAPAAMLVKNEVIKKIKGFDNKYFATYEDTDYCFRAKKAGYKTYYAPDAVAWHKITTDSDEEVKRLLGRAYYVGKNRILFMKDFGKLTFYLFLPLFFLYYLRLSLKYNNGTAVINYIKGSLKGLFQ